MNSSIPAKVQKFKQFISNKCMNSTKPNNSEFEELIKEIQSEAQKLGLYEIDARDAIDELEVRSVQNSSLLGDIKIHFEEGEFLGIIKSSL